MAFIFVLKFLELAILKMTNKHFSVLLLRITHLEKRVSVLRRLFLLIVTSNHAALHFRVILLRDVPCEFVHMLAERAFDEVVAGVRHHALKPLLSRVVLDTVEPPTFSHGTTL